MIRNASLFGSNRSHDQSFYIDILNLLQEDSFHHMDTILQLGETSQNLYFVTSGQVGVFVNMEVDYTDIIN